MKRKIIMQYVGSTKVMRSESANHCGTEASVCALYLCFPLIFTSNLSELFWYLFILCLIEDSFSDVDVNKLMFTCFVKRSHDFLAEVLDL